MFKNWTAKKTIITLVVIAIIAFILYELKVFGNTNTFLNIGGGDASRGSQNGTNRSYAVGGIVNPDMPGTGGGTQKAGSVLVYNRPGQVVCPAGTTLFLGVCEPNATTRISRDVSRFINSPAIVNQPPVNKEQCLCGSGKVITCIGYKNCSACCKDDNYPN